MKLLNIILLPFLMFVSSSSFAHLGGHESDIPGEARVAGANHTISEQNNQLKVHILTIAGDRIKEFVNSNGQIFAVSWHGRNTPNFNSLFGKYYGEYNVAFLSRVRLPGHRFLNLNTASLHVEQYGTMKHIQGKAYVVGQIPAGVRLEDLK